MGHPSPLFSVIIPHFNRPQLLPRALASVRAQTLNQKDPGSMEIIVVDDGSSLPVNIHPVDNLTVLTLGKNQGPAAARNRGLRQARGKYLAFLDSDDAWTADKLEKQSIFFEQNPDILYQHTDEHWEFAGQKRRPRKRHRKQGGFFLKRALELCLISPSAVATRREFFDQVGYWNEDLRVAEDYELWLRAQLRFPAGFIDEPLTLKYAGDWPQLSRKFYNIDLFRLSALIHIMKTEYLKPDQRQLFQNQVQRFRDILIAGAEKYKRPLPAGLVREIDFWAG